MMKAQIWSMDFVISVIMFFATISFLFFAWNYASSQTRTQISLISMQKTSLTVSDSLVRIPGIPKNWDMENVVALGLVNGEYEINETKLGMFLDMSYSKAKKLLLDKNYEFYFEMRDMNNTLIELSGENVTKGTYPSASSSIVAPVTRHAMYNGKIITVNFILWI